MVDPHIYYLLLVANAFFSILAPKIALLISLTAVVPNLMLISRVLGMGCIT